MLIHEFYAKEIAASGFTAPAVHMLIDTEMLKDEMKINAYIHTPSETPNEASDAEDAESYKFVDIPVVHSNESNLACKVYCTSVP